MNGIFRDVVAEIVGFTVANPTPNPTAGHPRRETTRMVISPVVIAILDVALAIRRASEFTGKHDKRIVEQTTLFEIRQ